MRASEPEYGYRYNARLQNAEHRARRAAMLPLRRRLVETGSALLLGLFVVLSWLWPFLPMIVRHLRGD